MNQDVENIACPPFPLKAAFGSILTMSSVDKAIATQLANIQAKTGKSLDEFRAILQQSGLTKHGELRSHLMETFGLGHGDANTVVHLAKQTDGASAAAGKSEDAVLDEIYTGPKADLRPIHEVLMASIQPFGDFEVAPKKGYVSLRRKKQFAMVGPATKTQIEVGINAKDLTPTAERLVVQAPGGMCQYKVRLSSTDEVNEELKGWLKQAFDAAG